MIQLGRAAPLALVCAMTFAQAPQQEITSNDSPATFQSRVNLVMVPVVVRDKHGNATGDLKREDFQLFDKGKPQSITRFSIEKSTDRPVVTDALPADSPETPGAVPTRFVAYVFDDLHTEFGDLVNARDATEKHLAETMKATDRAAIYTTSGINMLDFTDDRDKIHQTLFALRPRSRQSGQAECPNMTYYMADQIQNKNDQSAMAAMVANTLTCANLTPSISTPGGSGSPDQAVAESLVHAAASMALGIGESETKTTLALLTTVVRRLSAAPGQRALILASSGFLITDDYRRDELDLMDRAIRSNVTISAINARGLYTFIPCSDASQSGQCNSTSAGIITLYQRQSALAEEESLAELADGTGGTFFHNNNDLVEGLRRVAARPEYLYVLGFSPQNLKIDGAFHALKVTIKNTKEYALQARRGYYAPKHINDPAEQAKQEVTEALFSRDELRDIPFEFQTQFFKPTNDTAKLGIIARIDVRQLHFEKVNGRNQNTLTVVSGVFDRNGNLIGGLEKTVQMKLKDETLAHLATGIAIKANFDLTPGTYAVRIVVRDSQGQMMAARNGAVEIP